MAQRILLVGVTTERGFGTSDDVRRRRAVAERAVDAHSFAQRHDAVDQRLGSRLTALYVDVDGHVLVDAVQHRVTPLAERAAAVRAAAHADDPARLGHLLPDRAHAPG